MSNLKRTSEGELGVDSQDCQIDEKVDFEPRLPFYEQASNPSFSIQKNNKSKQEILNLNFSQPDQEQSSKDVLHLDLLDF